MEHIWYQKGIMYLDEILSYMLVGHKRYSAVNLEKLLLWPQWSSWSKARIHGSWKVFFCSFVLFFDIYFKLLIYEVFLLILKFPDTSSAIPVFLGYSEIPIRKSNVLNDLLAERSNCELG